MKTYLIFLLLVVSLSNATAKVINNEITAIASIQDAEGITQKDFSLEALQVLENDTLIKVQQKARAILIKKGFSNPKINLTPSSVYVEVDKRKLAVIRLKDDYSNQIFVLGIIGKELRKVVCVRESTEPIPLTYGECGKKIEDVYGIKFPYTNN